MSQVSSHTSGTSLWRQNTLLAGSRPQASQSTAMPRVWASRSFGSVTEVIEW
jgi:hypothetical protein